MSRIIKSNFILILFFIVCLAVERILCIDFFYSVGFYGNRIYLWFVLPIHLFMFFIALTPAVETVLRFLNGVRRIRTSRDQNYLFPAFKTVYERAYEKYPRLSTKIRLYIDNSMTVNAYAMGSRTIVVTRGAYETLSLPELEGVLAHEFGHIANGDTKLLLILMSTNIVVALIISIVKLIMLFFKALYKRILEIPLANIIIPLIKTLVESLIYIFVLTINGIVALNSRNNEYSADKFAHDIGFGSELIESLYMLQKTDFSNKLSLVERIQASHPYLENRIAKLEDME